MPYWYCATYPNLRIGFLIKTVSRYLAVLQPMRLYQMDRRGKLMIAVAWIASIICSLPQVTRVHFGYRPKKKKTFEKYRIK